MQDNETRDNKLSTLGWRVDSNIKMEFVIEARRKNKTAEEAIDEAMRGWLGQKDPEYKVPKATLQAFEKFFLKPRSDSDNIFRDALLKLFKARYDLK